MFTINTFMFVHPGVHVKNSELVLSYIPTCSPESMPAPVPLSRTLVLEVKTVFDGSCL